MSPPILKECLRNALSHLLYSSSHWTTGLVTTRKSSKGVILYRNKQASSFSLSFEFKNVKKASSRIRPEPSGPIIIQIEPPRTNPPTFMPTQQAEDYFSPEHFLDVCSTVSLSNESGVGNSQTLSPAPIIPSNPTKRQSSGGHPTLAINTRNLNRFKTPVTPASPDATPPSPSPSSAHLLSPVLQSPLSPTSALDFSFLSLSPVSGSFPQSFQPQMVRGKFVCHFVNCGKTFDKKYCLTSHWKTHTLEKPHVCGCGKSFGRNHDLLRHIRTVHSSIEYEKWMKC